MEAQQIPPEEIDAVNLSAVDQSGTVFRWRGGFYRALRAECAPFYARLFRDGTIPRLVERGLLVGSELVPLKLEGFDSIVRHREIEFVTFPYEWCAPMIRDAAIAVLELVAELEKDGLTLKDGHLFNSLFDGCHPVHVDLTSIVPSDQHAPWPGAAEFRARCIHPLLLMEQGDDRLARMLIFEELAVTREDVFRWRRAGTYTSSVRRLAADFGGAIWQQFHQSLRDRFGRQAGQIGAVEELRAELGASPHPTDETSLDSRIPDPDERATRDLLDRLRPRTVLDAGCKSGGYSQLAAGAGASVVAFDKDPARVASVYRKARTERLSVLPLVMDFCRPTPSSGPLDYWSSGATKRLRSELVLAMEMVPSLVARQGLHFRELAAGLAAFSTRWVLVRFHTSSHPMPGWYRAENLIGNLRAEFRAVEPVPGEAARDSLLILCEK